eukprot:TRINITY_DN108281_c0_g1_i1.p1 TRINITY_DN108281_c0_g1~~TRINITY_DN108281_c0_g1_i1.p1  ORF type:complete len:291 (+),score=58.36 TRINITY_DN108281_c0_g1_i1:42-914(+)
MAAAALVAVAALIYFLTALAGGLAVIYISGLSLRWKQLCNALAGGVLIGVALCHMLADSLEGVESWGKAISKALGGDPDDAYPIGLALAGCGFFLVVGLEYLLGGHSHGESHSTEKKAQGMEALESGSECTSDESEVAADGGDGGIVGIATLVGLTIHSLIEGVATGAAESDDTLSVLVLAVVLHKGFAAFAVSTSLVELRKRRKALWWALVVFFALTSPVGIAIGAILTSQFPPTLSAFLQCLAAGTLLAVGIGDMIYPAFEDIGVWKRRKLFAAVFGFFSMALLAVWA